MSRIFFIVIVLIGFTFGVAAQSGGISWQTDYQQALILSRETGKPILIDFWAKWCQPCMEMDREFWTRADVAEAMKVFVPLKVNYDEQKQLNSQFAVRGLPYVAISDSYGSLIGSRTGFGNFTAAYITRIFDTLPKDLSVLDEPFKILETKTNDSDALLKIAGCYAKNKLPVAAGKYYKLAFDSPEIKNSYAKKQPVLYEIGRQFQIAGDNYQAAFAFQDYLKLFPDGALREKVYADLIGVKLNIGKLDEASARLDELKKEFPASPEIKDAEITLEAARKQFKK